MEFIEYLGNLYVGMRNKKYKVSNVNIIETGKYGVLELEIASRNTIFKQFQKHSYEIF